MVYEEPIDSVDLTDTITVSVHHDGFGKRPDMDRSVPQYEVRFEVFQGGSAEFPMWGNVRADHPSAAEAARSVISDAMRAHIAADETGVDLPAYDDVTLGSLSTGGKYADLFNRMVGEYDLPPSEELRAFQGELRTAVDLRYIGIEADDLNELDEKALAASEE